MSIYRRKDSKYWWFRFQVPGGKRIQGSTLTSDKKLAEEFADLKEHQWRRALQAEALGVKYQGTYWWFDAAARWLNEKANKRSLKDDIAKFNWLEKYLGPLTLAEINIEVLDRIAAAKKGEGAEIATVNRYLQLVRAVLRRARDRWKWVDDIPYVELRRESNARDFVLSHDQARLLIEELPAALKDPARFALLTGLRRANVTGLRWEHIHLTGPHPHISIPGHHMKSGERHNLPLNNDAVTVLHRQRGQHEHIVFTKSGRPLTHFPYKAFQAATVRAGLAGLCWHDLRHTWATWQLQAGTPLHEVQRLGGWKSPLMAQRYAHQRHDDLAPAAARLEGILSGDDPTIGTVIDLAAAKRARRKVA